MPVRFQFRLAGDRQEIKPVPERRQLIARPWFRIVAVERGGKPCNRDRRDYILGNFFTANPRSQFIDIDRHFASFDLGRMSSAGRARPIRTAPVDCFNTLEVSAAGIYATLEP